MKQDGDIWNHLDPDAPTIMDERDANVMAYQAFVAEFPRISDMATAPQLLRAANDG